MLKRSSLQNIGFWLDLINKKRMEGKIREEAVLVEEIDIMLIWKDLVTIQSYNPKRQRTSLSVNCLEQSLLLEIEILRYLLILLGPCVCFTTGFCWWNWDVALRSTTEVKLLSFFFQYLLEFGMFDTTLNLFHLSVRETPKHDFGGMFMYEVGSYLCWGGSVLQMLKLLCWMGIVRPFLCIKKDIISSHFFLSIKIYWKESIDVAK